MNFPSVLAMMNERLDWTQKLGDAFLAQEEQVMATVQTLREKAYAQGSLRTSGNQNVVVQEKVIVVEPANPDVITVPVYDPYVVYGPWWYPAYPPYAFYPPGFIVGSSVLFFGTGVFFGAAWGYAWGGFDWHHHHCFIDVNQHIRFNRHIDRRRFADRFAAGPDGRGRWRHDPVHRKGVIYRDRTTRERFGQGQRPGTGARQEFRGRFPDGGTGGQGASIAPPWSGRGVHPAATVRPPAGLGISRSRSVPGAAVHHPGAMRPSAPPLRPAPRPERPAVSPQRPRSVFDRLERSGSEAGSSSQRGSESRQRMVVPRPAVPSGGGGPPADAYAEAVLERPAGEGPAEVEGEGERHRGDIRQTARKRRRIMIPSVSDRKNGRQRQCGVAIGAALLLLLFAHVPVQAAAVRGPQQKTFPSPEEAVKAMIAAVRAHDVKAMRVVLGPGSKGIVSSGDEAADREDREEFVKSYESSTGSRWRVRRERSSGWAIMTGPCRFPS